MFISSLYNAIYSICLNSFADHKYPVIEYSVLPCSAGLRLPVCDFQTSSKGITWELTEKVYSQALPHSYPVKTPKVVFPNLCFNIPSVVFNAHSSLRVTAPRKASANCCKSPAPTLESKVSLQHSHTHSSNIF